MLIVILISTWDTLSFQKRLAYVMIIPFTVSSNWKQHHKHEWNFIFVWINSTQLSSVAWIYKFTLDASSTWIVGTKLRKMWLQSVFLPWKWSEWNSIHYQDDSLWKKYEIFYNDVMLYITEFIVPTIGLEKATSKASRASNNVRSPSFCRYSSEASLFTRSE